MKKIYSILLMTTLLLTSGNMWADMPLTLAEPEAFQQMEFVPNVNAPARIAKVSPAPLSVNEAKIGETEYATFAEAMAVAVANTEGQTKVEVLRDHTESTTAANLFTIPATADVLIELNGYTIHYDHNRASGAFLFTVNGGKLTIEDHSNPSTGEISMTGATTCGSSYSYNTDLIRVDNGGLLTVNGGTLANYSTGVGCPYVVDIFTSTPSKTSSVIINGGLLYQPYNYALRVFGASGTCAASFTMNGGEVKATRPIWFQLPGADATSPIMDFLMTGGKLTSVKGSDGESFSIYSYGQNYDKVTVTVTGGEFVGKFAVGTGTANGGLGNEKVTISGGIFYDGFNSYHRGIERQVIEGGVFYMDLRTKQVQVNGYWSFLESWFGNYSGYYSKEYYESKGYILYPVWNEQYQMNQVYFFKQGIPLPEMVEYIKPGHYAAIMCADEDGEFEHEGMKFNPGKCSEEMFWAVIDGEGPRDPQDVTESGIWSTGTDGVFTELPNIQTDVTVKEDQTITVTAGTKGETNRLILENGAAIIVENGAKLEVGLGGVSVSDGAKVTSITVMPGGIVRSEGTVVSAKNEQIIINANAGGAGSLIIAPDVNFNQQPKSTVNMTAHVGINNGEYYWHRFALPVLELAAPWVKTPEVPTALYQWDYTEGDWVVSGASTDMVPFTGYNITANTELGDVTYSFQGNLLGNVSNGFDFQALGYGFFGNSFTGYILAKEMLADFQEVDGVEAQVWMWETANQSYTGVSFQDLNDDRDLEDFEREVAPMQTFILRTNSGAGSTINIDYLNAIWNNPRYTHSAPQTPRRTQANGQDVFAKIMVTSAAGQTDRVRLTESEDYTDAYENGVDATKYMNANTFNLYLSVDGEDYTSLYTNNLDGKRLTLQTRNEVSYTLTMGRVDGEEYQLKDLLTGAIIPMAEGTTYHFSAQPNSTSARFEVVRANRVPTSMDEIEATHARGIYTVLGQYLGESDAWDALPRGVYVIDGVKVVK